MKINYCDFFMSSNFYKGKQNLLNYSLSLFQVFEGKIHFECSRILLFKTGLII